MKSTFHANVGVSVGDATDISGHVAVGAPSHIAFFIRALDGGGAQRDAILLANALTATGTKVSILTLVPEGRLASLVDDSVAIHHVRAKRLATAVNALRGTINKVKPDVLLSSEAAANVAAFAAVSLLNAKVRPRLVLREVTAPSVAKTLDPYFQNRLAFRLAGYVYSRADRVLTLTAGARRDLISNFGVPPERISVMTSNAVIDPSTAERLSRPEATATVRQRGLIIAIGRLSPEKDHLTLIEAFADLRKHTRARLVIVGEGPMRPALEDAIARHGLGDFITLAGASSDPFEWLLKAEVLVSSSKFEGLGNVLIEALACGTPVVSTDCPYGPREVLEGGRLGQLVPVADPKALASAIERTLATPPDRAALRRAAEKHTARHAARCLLTNMQFG
ncbi:glycosyltransferase [Hyphomicrobium sp.]|uniref:glycosyltransferase n=1 Tax=Hyphomicrobium sp. TaxID=82 RepID=UPI002D778E89|nr:glycosyltransferase [Hyphomicrobium sp.]HET6388075.1 glycosyltransferase [Hyphomicrobium sp.]